MADDNGSKTLLPGVDLCFVGPICEKCQVSHFHFEQSPDALEYLWRSLDFDESKFRLLTQQSWALTLPKERRQSVCVRWKIGPDKELLGIESFSLYDREDLDWTDFRESTQRSIESAKQLASPLRDHLFPAVPDIPEPKSSELIARVTCAACKCAHCRVSPYFLRGRDPDAYTKCMEEEVSRWKPLP